MATNHTLDITAISAPALEALPATMPVYGTSGSAAWRHLPPKVIGRARNEGATVQVGTGMPGETVEAISAAKLREQLPEVFPDYNPVANRFNHGKPIGFDMFAPRDPQAGDPVIRSWGDLYRNFTDRQVDALFRLQDWPVVQNGTGPKAKALRDTLNIGAWNHKRSEVLRWLAFTVNAQPLNYRAKFNLGTADFATPVEFERELGNLNRHLVAKWAQGLLEPGDKHAERKDALLQIAVGLGAKPTAPVDGNLAVFVTAMVSEIYTARAIAFDEAVEAYAAQGAHFNADTLTGTAVDVSSVRAATVQGSAGVVQTPAEQPGMYHRYTREQMQTARGGCGCVAGSQGIADSFKKLVRHPLKWGRSVLKEFGKGVSQGAAFLLDNIAKVPWLDDYIVKPTFIGAQLEVIRQLGNAMVEGTIAAFEEQAVATNFAEGAQVAGAVALAVAPLLPPPFNIAVAATGAVLVAAARGIMAAQASTKAINQREDELKQIEAAKKAGQAERAAAEEDLLALENEQQQARTLAEEARKRAEASAQTRKYALAAGLAIAAVGAVFSLSR